ncbi:MAG TPA: helix-turn-helix transcriptional regulator [Candidatus Limnocylindria bacterium]|jgi:PadR family transcriptional regulator PadR
MSPLSRSQLLKGTTEMLILGVIENERLHGYDILQRIRDAGSGLIVSEGALYPALHRLEKRGAVTGTWEPGSGGPRRRYYALTELGRGQLAESRREWERFVADVEAVASAPAPAEGRNG